MTKLSLSTTKIYRNNNIISIKNTKKEKIGDEKLWENYIKK